MNKHRGFTLIELLVVIAIIGILSSIVIVGIGNARLKARDVSIKQEMNSLRTEIEQWALFTNGGRYFGGRDCTLFSSPSNCPGCATLDNILKKIKADNGDTEAGNGYVTCAGNDDQSSYCVVASLPSLRSSKSFCIDGTGFHQVLNKTVDEHGGNTACHENGVDPDGVFYCR